MASKLKPIRFPRRLLLLLIVLIGALAALIYVYQIAPAARMKANARKHEQLGADALKAGDSSGAESQWLAAIAAWPGDVDAYAALGDYYRLNGQSEVAATAYQQLIRLDPGYPDGYTRLGLAAYDAGLTEEAERAAQEELSHDPNSVEALDILARLNQHRGKFQQARSEAEKAFHLQPASEETALVYTETFLPEDIPGAIRVLAPVAEKLPTSWRILYKLGWCYARVAADTEGVEKAIQVLKRAEALQPTLGLIHTELCGLLLKQNAAFEAVQEGKLAVQLDPTSPAALFSEAQALQRAGQTAEAQKTMDRFRTLQAAGAKQTDLQRRFLALPDNLSIARDLVAVDEQLGDTRDALVVLQVARSHHPEDKGIQRELARLLEHQGQ